MPWLLVLVLLAACERQGDPVLWRAPKVGDRSSAMFQYTANIEGPDGRTHVMTNVNELTSEVIALDGEFPTVMRMTIVRNEHALDGVPKSGIAGTFELTQVSDGVLDVTRVGGAITEEQRAFFSNSSRHPSRATVAASKRFVRQSFKVGQTHALTPDEITGLGLGMSSVELTVTDVNAAGVVFDVTTAGDFAGLGGTLRATGTLRLLDGGRELSQDGEILRDGRPIGTLQVVLRSRAIRQ